VDGPLLPVATEEKKDLRLESVPFSIFVEPGEERVFLKDFEHQLGVEPRLEQARQRGLSHADHALDN
jgi:hypothetical protein